MSDPHPEIAPSATAEEFGPPAPPSPAPPLQERTAPSPSPAMAASLDRKLALWLAGVLVLVIVLVATAPFWGPALPWAAGPARDDTALLQRLDRLEATRQRIDRLEASQKTAEQQIQQTQQGLQQQSGAVNAAVQPLEHRVAVLEARPPVPPGDIADLRQQIGKLTEANAQLAARVAASDKAVQARAASDTTDMALLLALLQIRDAVEAGRPFAAEYEALKSLARARPDIAAAAVALAEPARTGTASRGVLISRLRALAGSIATAKESAAPSGDWRDQALSRLRGLVTIRRIDGAAAASTGNGPDGAVHAAEMAVAGGDLEGAVAILDKLTGAPAEAAAPWVRMARQRLAVESALRQIEALLVARLGNAASPAAPAVSGSPG